MREKRRQRVCSFLRQEIAEILQRDVSDPRLGMVSVTRVEPTDDLKEARVYVSVLGTEAAQRTALRGIRAARSHIQALLGERLHFRNTPMLEFIHDQSFDRSREIADLIAQARREDDDAAKARGGLT